MISAREEIAALEISAEAEAGLRRPWIRPTVERIEAGSAESLSNVVSDGGVTQS